MIEIETFCWLVLLQLLLPVSHCITRLSSSTCKCTFVAQTLKQNMTVVSGERGREYFIGRDITTASRKRETGNPFMEPKCDGFLTRAVYPVSSETTLSRCFKLLLGPNANIKYVPCLGSAVLECLHEPQVPGALTRPVKATIYRLACRRTTKETAARSAYVPVNPFFFVYGHLMIVCQNARLFEGLQPLAPPHCKTCLPLRDEASLSTYTNVPQALKPISSR